MFNKYILDPDTLRNLDKRRELRKKLAQEMIIDTSFRKIERFILRIVFLAVVIFSITHSVEFGHYLHFHVHG